MDGVQAPQALDDDGLGVVSVGTAAWAVALIVALVLHQRLARDGHLWWIACAAVGFGLGLLGLAYCVRRRRRLARPAAATRPGPSGDRTTAGA